MADIPSYIHEPIVDKNGYLTDSWQLTISQLLSQLQQGISNEGGYQVPQKTTDEITQLTNAPDGTHVYNTTENTPMVKKNGVFVTYG